MCGILGHSDVEVATFGITRCARCGEQMCDSGGKWESHPSHGKVNLHHHCEKCPPFTSLRWRDKLLLDGYVWLTESRWELGVAEILERVAQNDRIMDQWFLGEERQEQLLEAAKLIKGGPLS